MITPPSGAEVAIADAAEQLGRFAGALWSPGDILEIRAFWPDKSLAAARRWCRADQLASDAMLAWMHGRNAQGAGLYVSVNPRSRRGGGTAESVGIARTLVVDFDGGEAAVGALARVAASGLPLASAVVASGHGVHCYWVLTEPLTDLALWTSHQKALIAALGTDRCVHDAPRVMRLPGFWNTKDQPVECRLLEADPQRVYSLGQFPSPALSAPAPSPAPPASSAPSTTAPLSRATQEFMAHGAVNGERNARLFQAACDLAGCGYSQAEAEGMLLEPATASPGDEPFTEAEARATVASAYSRPRTPTAEPWAPPVPLAAGPQPQPFPIAEAFGPGLSVIRDYLAAVAEELQVPVDLPAMLLLPVITVAISQKVEAEPRPGWREVPPLWTLTLAPPSERKSPVFSRLMRPVYTWQQEEAERLGPEIAAAKEARKIDEKRLEEFRKKAVKGDGQSREDALALAQAIDARGIPAVPALVVSDATTEAVCQVLVENHERAIVASAEADALDVMLGRYSEKGAPNMGIWLKGYSGDPETVRRRSRPPEHLDRPTLSVGLTVQPEAVRGMYSSQAARGRGLLARFLTAAPQSRVGRRKTGGAAATLPEHLATAYFMAITRLLTIDIPAEGPLIVTLSPEAQAMFNEFEGKLEPELARGGLLGDRADWGGKLCGTLARIALALHMLQVWGVEGGGGSGGSHSARSARCAPSKPPPISGATMRAALAWMPYLTEHERHVAGLLGCDQATTLADGLLSWLLQTGLAEFSRRDAFSQNRSTSLRKVEEIDPALNLLEELGYIRRRPAPTRAPGQRGQNPSPVYDVNPRWERRGRA